MPLFIGSTMYTPIIVDKQEGGSSTSTYWYQNTQGTVTVPSRPIDEDNSWFFGASVIDANFQNYKNSTASFSAIIPNAGFLDEIKKIFDKDNSTYISSGFLGETGYIYFKGTNLRTIKIKCLHTDSLVGYFKIYGTNNVDDQCYVENMTELKQCPIEYSENIQDVEYNIPTGYDFYMLNFDVYATLVYEIEFTYISGAQNCILSSGNMTPEIKFYANDYPQVITQPWYNGSRIIDSQKLIMKPFSNGGALYNYTDDGSAVILNMYLLQPSGQTIISEIPFVRPNLTENGTIGGDSFAVAMDSQIDAGRPAWKAFDGQTIMINASTDQAHTASGQPHWIEFYNPEEIQVTQITIFNGADNVLPLDWEFQCSDDNEAWTTLTSGTNSNLTSNGEWSFNVSNSGWHKYYRFYTTSGYGADSGYLGITEIQIEGTEKISITYDKYIYILTPYTSFNLPIGYISKTLVGTLSLPQHSVYSE